MAALAGIAPISPSWPIMGIALPAPMGFLLGGIAPISLLSSIIGMALPMPMPMPGMAIGFLLAPAGGAAACSFATCARRSAI